MTCDKLLSQLSKRIEEERIGATYTIGGNIPVVKPSSGGGSSQLSPSATRPEAGKPALQSLTKAPSAPITIRWDSTTVEGLISKITLPCEPGDASSLENLVNDCQPATFGHNGKDIYDETYRKATKLDTTAFSSTFNPYEVGIIDVIAQILLPSLPGGDISRGVRAELYKLNVYSGPSGKFKAHVDTPRGSTQFGSLVVCLPCDHEGGELVVRHNGNAIIYNWGSTGAGSTDAAEIQWAAFYSDCEHEVLEVKSGHRITLTYHLYIASGSGDLAGRCPWLDPTALPLYDAILSMLELPAFMKEGGLVGVYCSHAYAHTHEEGIKHLPGSLKGSDMALYEIFKALNLEVNLKPILDPEYLDDYGDEEETSVQPKREYIGDMLYSTYLSDISTEDCSTSELVETWGSHTRETVVWLTQPKHSDAAMAYLAYGNQAEMGVLYSNAALIVKIPAFTERNL
ncbi:uncharacterized protein BDZ99DRAFT_452136 [Mytilinidion resinicola]|uniref:Fe2OG dioxygenase domain-containing protein n=1 Tax=Mytilinidion resinicola TaxID=574789 RepID=A0A6A6Y6L2_9PEZI|nr:uncharacterized protein BDZ99DRAFT_452136 [Mytilinidion resinicola]KAF2804168.1 hypothetical protein BDZ99DRAFT_452136 [Mytilinidion resinicola]